MGIVRTGVQALAVITIGMLFIYIYGMTIRKFRNFLAPVELWVSGLFFGIAAMAAFLSEQILAEGSMSVAGTVYLALGIVFCGYQGAVIILVVLFSALILGGQTVATIWVTHVMAAVVIGFVFHGWIRVRGYKRFYFPLVLMGLLLGGADLISDLGVGGSWVVDDYAAGNPIVLFLLVPLMTFVVGGIYLMELERRDKELELIASKEDLTVNNEEITALYEEMAAAEETLQEQFDQLRDHREEIMRINEKYNLVYRAGNEGLWDFDYTTGETYLSDRITEIYGYGPEQKPFMIENRNKLIHPDDLPEVKQAWRALKEGTTDVYDMEYRILHASGEYRWIHAKGTVLRDEDGRNLIMAGSHGDIHQRKLQEQKLYESAYTDSLTGLRNRRWILEKLDRVLLDTIQCHGVGAVVILGLDGFKAINETMSMRSGDEILIQTASRVRAVQKEGVFTARLSGDEFMIIMSDIPQRYEVDEVLGKILMDIHRPMRFNGQEIQVTASAGVVIFPKDASGTDAVLRNCDMALIQAKKRGKNCHVFFDEKMAKESMRYIQMDAGLSNALTNNEFQLHYQPIFNSHSRALSGFEALLRWNSPEFGFVPPDVFIRIAERSGKIVDMGNWVIQEACRFHSLLPKDFASDIYVSVNVSPVQIMQKDFVMQVKEIIGNAGVPPGCIVMEITETAMMESFDVNSQKLSDLQEWGIKFFLDDFGTGFSSLNYLGRLPVATLKIDKGFIDELQWDGKQIKMVRGIVNISHQLGLTVIAEGVEEEAQLEILKGLECDCIQGYLLGRPLAESKALELTRGIS